LLEESMGIVSAPEKLGEGSGVLTLDRGIAEALKHIEAPEGRGLLIGRGDVCRIRCHG
jgi:hypothetical protein